MAAAPRLGSVEVQKDTGSRLWYSGRVTDVLSDAVVVVAFENDVWPQAEFPVPNIRKPPKLSAAELERFSPHINEEVELRVAGTDHAPGGWGTALVRNIKHTFYFVSLVSAEDTSAIVEKDQLRPKTVSTGLPGGLLKQEPYKLPRELEAWICTSDATQCFEHIEEQSGLIFIQTLRSELRLIGDAKTIQRAKMLLQLHIKHQGKIQSFQETLEKQLTALEKKRNRIEGTGYKHSIEFEADAKSIPRIIGKGGEAIRSLQDKYEVNISILPQEGEDGRRIVRIFGNSTDSIEKARADVEYVEEAMTVEPKMKSWILGKGGKTIQSFKESANLLYAHLDSEGEQLWLKGTRRSVYDAKAMFETHFMYFNVFLQMDEEMDQILDELQEYGDTNARWEWGWYRDEDDEYPKGGGEWKGCKGGGKGAKSGGKGGKSGGGKKGKEWEEPAITSGGKKGKDWDEVPVAGEKTGREWEEAPAAGGKRGGKKGKDWDEAPVAGEKTGREWEEAPAAGGKRGGKKGKDWDEAPVAGEKTGREWEEAPTAGGKRGKELNTATALSASGGKKGKDSEEAPVGSGKRGKEWEEAPSASGKRSKEWEEPPSVGGRRGKEWEEPSAAGGRKDKEWEEPPPARPARGRGGKGGKGASKSGDWQVKEEQGVGEEDGDAAEGAGQKGAGRGGPARTGAAGARNGRAAASGGGATAGGRAAAAAAAGPEREPRLAPSGAPSGRRMGKKGLRS